jgi:tripartite-type tricarboxylate transporter receptor subunit TctC
MMRVELKSSTRPDCASETFHHEEFAAHIRSELKKWGEVAKAANIRAD